MNTQQLLSFIDRYHLKSNESVTWKKENNTLTVRFQDDTSSVLGTIKIMEDGTIPEGEYHIFQTSDLRKKLSILDDTFEFDVVTNKKDEPVAIKLNDAHSQVQFGLADPVNILPVAEVDNLPDFNIKISLNAELSSRYVKAKAAMPESDMVSFVTKNDKIKLVLGSPSGNGSKITLAAQGAIDEPITQDVQFNADHLRELIHANRDATEGYLEVSDEGIMKVWFVVDTYQLIEYYLMAIDEI